MNVILAEDSVLLRAGIARLLTDAGMTIVAEADDGEMAIAVVELHQPDIVVMDVRMPPTPTDEGIRAALTIRRRFPQIAVLVLSQYVEQYYASELLAGDNAGVGYLLKDRVADVREFVAAVKHVASGGSALDAEVVSELLARVRRGRPLESLTPRELEVMRLMAEGRSNAAIAAQLVVGEGAVEKHITSICNRLDLAPADTDHRRVLAVLRYLEASQ
jgi:DNA-binding NarL/FixJ family response regulator